MTAEIRSIFSLTHDAIVQMAREQAEAGEAMAHGYEQGSTQAITWEHHYLARQRELEQVEV